MNILKYQHFLQKKNELLTAIDTSQCHLTKKIETFLSIAKKKKKKKKPNFFSHITKPTWKKVLKNEVKIKGTLLNTQIYSAIVVFAELEANREEEKKKKEYVCMYIYNQKAEGFIFPLDSQLLKKPQRKARPKEEEA